jgi:hypothetical protein
VPQPTFQEHAATSFTDTASAKSVVGVEVGNGWRLVAYAMTEDDQYATTISDSIGYTWALVEDAAEVDYARVQAWTATAHVAASPAMDVTFTPSPAGGRYWGGGVLVYNNSEGFGSSEQTTGSGQPLLNMATLQLDSALVTLVSDWNAMDGATRTWRTVNGLASTSTLYERNAAFASFYVGRRDTTGPIGPETTGLTVPTGQKFQIVGVEVRGIAPEFPKTGLLDDFTRADQTPPGGSWSTTRILDSDPSGLSVSSNQLRFTSGNNNAYHTAPYGPDVETFATISTLPPDGEYVALFNRLINPGSGAWGAYYLVWIKGATTDTYSIRKRFDGTATTLANPTSLTLSAGGGIGLSVVGSTIKVWKGTSGGTWSQVGTFTDTDIATAGLTGIEISHTTTRVDAYSGGTIGAPLAAPANTSAPALSGTATVGNTLTCSTGIWTGVPTPTYTHQWKRNNAPISGATNTTYTLTVTDQGQSVKCTVTGTNSSGFADADSNSVTPTAGGGAVAFPTLAVLDAFTRADQQPPGGSWATTGVSIADPTGLAVASNQLRFISGSNNGYMTPTYGPGIEQYCTISTLPANGEYVALFARVRNPGSGSWEGLLLVWIKGATNDTWSVRKRFDGTTSTITEPVSPTITAGQKIGWDIVGATIRLYKTVGGTWEQVGGNLTTGFSEITWAGNLGVEISTTSTRIDDLGGGNTTIPSTTLFKAAGLWVEKPVKVRSGGAWLPS